MDERDLVDRCLSGNEEAWKEFLGRYGSVIRGAAGRFLRSLRLPPSTLDVDDVAHRVLEMLVDRDYRLLREFRWDCPLEGWLHVLVRTACVRFARRKRPALTRESAASEQDGPLETLLSREAQEVVRDLVARLPDRERRVIDLFFVQGKPYAEICAEMGLPMGTVATILARTRARLRDELRGRGIV